MRHVTNVAAGQATLASLGRWASPVALCFRPRAKPSGETRSDPLLPATWPQIDALSLHRIRAVPDEENALAVPLTSTHPVATPDRPCQRNAAGAYGRSARCLRVCPEVALPAARLTLGSRTVLPHVRRVQRAPRQRNVLRPSVPGAAYASYERLGLEHWPLRAESHYRRAVIHMVWTERGGGR